MKKVGIVGGIGPASTVDYYLGVIEDFRKAHGADVYPELVIDSINMHDMIEAMGRGDDAAVAAQIVASLQNLKNAGADFAAIASNTPHYVWKQIKAAAPLPVLSIVEATCAYIRAQGYQTVVVFGTKFTMSNGLYDRALAESGVNVAKLRPEDIEEVGNIVYPNLENGLVIPEDKVRMISVAERYIKEYAADALVLGCTEIPLMIKPGDVSAPIVNTTEVHVAAIGKLLS